MTWNRFATAMVWASVLLLTATLARIGLVPWSQTLQWLVLQAVPWTGVYVVIIDDSRRCDDRVM